MSASPSERKLTPQNCTLVLIDLQNGPVSTVASMPSATLAANAVYLARAARILDLPVVLAAAAVPGPSGEFVPGLEAALPPHRMVPHATNNAWDTPEFVAAIEAVGRHKLVIAGVATDVGLCLTALAASAAGYDVFALIDVSGTLDLRLEQAAWLRMTQGDIALTSWTAFLAEVQGSYLTGCGPQLRTLIAESLAAQAGPFTVTHEEKSG